MTPLSSSFEHRCDSCTLFFITGCKTKQPAEFFKKISLLTHGYLNPSFGPFQTGYEAPVKSSWSLQHSFFFSGSGLSSQNCDNLCSGGSNAHKWCFCVIPAQSECSHFQGRLHVSTRSYLNIGVRYLCATLLCTMAIHPQCLLLLLVKCCLEPFCLKGDVFLNPSYVCNTIMWQCRCFPLWSE